VCGGNSGPLPPPTTALGLSAVADDDEVARPALNDEDARAAVDDEDARAAVDDMDARVAVDEEEARATDDFGAAVTAQESTDVIPGLEATAFQSNGKEKNKDKSNTNGFVMPGVFFRVMEGTH